MRWVTLIFMATVEGDKDYCLFLLVEEAPVMIWTTELGALKWHLLTGKTLIVPLGSGGWIWWRGALRINIMGVNLFSVTSCSPVLSELDPESVILALSRNQCKGDFADWPFLVAIIIIIEQSMGRASIVLMGRPTVLPIYCGKYCVGHFWIYRRLKVVSLCTYWLGQHLNHIAKWFIFIGQ